MLTNRNIFILASLVFIFVSTSTVLLKRISNLNKLRTHTNQLHNKRTSKIAQTKKSQNKSYSINKASTKPKLSRSSYYKTNNNSQNPIIASNADLNKPLQTNEMQDSYLEQQQIKEISFLQQSLGLVDVEVQAVQQQQTNHLRELEYYDFQIKQGMADAESLKIEAVKNHQQWMNEHIGEEGFQQLLSI